MEAKRICPYCMGELESRVSVSQFKLMFAFAVAKIDDDEAAVFTFDAADFF